MKGKTLAKIKMGVLAVVALMMVSGGNSFAKSQGKNAALLSATSPFEDLIEYALAEDTMEIQRAIASAENQFPQVRGFLSRESADRLGALLAAIKQSKEKADYNALALSSAEAYRLLVEELDAGDLKVPVEVNLLDYAGFKILILAKAKVPNWPSIGATVEESAKNWNFIEPKIRDQGLRDVFSTMEGGLQQATKTRNVQMLEFGARVQLDLVDLLEGYFLKKSFSR